MKNIGKIFESDFVASIPNNILLKRLNDNIGAWSNSNKNSRFTTTNECDYIMYDDMSRCFYGLELKSTKNTLTFWRKDFEENDKIHNRKSNFNIRKCQILGLEKWKKHHVGVFGFIINFRSENNATYFVSIDNFIDYTSKINKKSIGIIDILKMNPIQINSYKKRVHYTYDIKEFVKNTIY